MNDTLLVSLTSISLVAVSSGLVGAFALMRKMTLASDAISHVALPGLGVALLAGLHPLIGGALALIAGAFLIWTVERRTKISTETVIGVVFSASLAIGSLLTPKEELLETLFGDVGSVNIGAAAAGIAVALGITAAILFLRDRLTLTIVSPDLSKTLGIRVDRLNLTFLLLFAINVILGLNFLGVLLMGSLIIVPAATAKNIAWSLNSDLAFSAILSVVSVVAGFMIAVYFGVEEGPAIISVASTFFFISLFFRRT